LILRRWRQIQSSQEKKMREAINKLIMDSGEVKNTTRTGKPLWTASTCPSGWLCPSTDKQRLICQSVRSC
jgi:hypothetical protein